MFATPRLEVQNVRKIDDSIEKEPGDMLHHPRIACNSQVLHSLQYLPRFNRRLSKSHFSVVYYSNQFALHTNETPVRQTDMRTLLRNKAPQLHA
jgi:hypothetical protein